MIISHPISTFFATFVLQIIAYYVCGTVAYITVYLYVNHFEFATMWMINYAAQL